ncbi:acyl-CoA synthetase family member 2, mitochondrial-like [Argonauta hians]
MASYIHRPGNIKFLYQTIPQRLCQLAEEDPNKPAIVFYQSKQDRRQISRKQLYEGSVNFGKALITLGVKKGELVAFCVSSCVEWMIYEAGIMLAGAIPVKLMLGLADFKTVLYGCNVVVFDSKFIWDNFLGVADILDNGRISSEMYPNLKLAIGVSEEDCPENVLSVAKLIKDASNKTDIIFPSISPDDTALIAQTSGSTGIPKRICHSHFNWINGFYSYYVDIGLVKEDIAYCSRPMGYIVGHPTMFLTIGCTHVTGDVKLLNNNQNMDFLMDLWKTEKCNILFLVPQRLKLIKETSLRVKRILCGGDIVLRSGIENSFNLADMFSVVYGSTETLIMAQRLFSKGDIEQHKDGMVGRPLPGLEAKILDENNKIVPIGCDGYLYIRSSWMQQKFQDGRSALEEGWISTSDIYRMTDEGDLIMLGRSSDFIKKGTVKLSVKVIEEYVSRYYSVADVVVVPIPDQFYGECVCACVTLTPGFDFCKDDLVKFCSETMPNPGNFDHVTLIPDYFLHFKSFPTLPSQKFNKVSIKSSAIIMVKELYGKDES